MEYIGQLYDELRAIYLQTLPEVEAGGVWVTQHLDRVPMETLEFPCGGIHIETFPRTHEWGTGLMLYNPTVHIYYLANQEWDSLEIAAQMEKLRDAFEFAEISNGQINWVEEVTWGDSLTPNAFFASKNNKARAGRISVNLLVGTQGTVALTDELQAG
jgi:hypothetical protein